MGKGKRYQEQLALIDRSTSYALDDAVKLVHELPKAKFDETVEMAFKLGIDPRQADQQVRGATTLPHGSGQTVSVLVFAQGETADAAREAGADFVGFEDMITSIQNGWTGFDTAIATPACMTEVRKLGRVLGPRGLMPNPKTGTVTDDVVTAVKEAKAGRIEYRTDRTGCVHVVIGKKSFTADQLVENARSIGDLLYRVRPAAVKGIYMRSCAISTTMSPGIKVDTREFTR